MTEALTQNPITELSARLDARRQQRDREVGDIIERSPAPQPGDADRLAELIEQDARDVAEINGRIEQRLHRHADEQRLTGLRARHDELRTEVYARERWQAAFSEVERLDEKLEALADGAVALSYADPLVFPNGTRPQISASYLRARGWKLYSPSPEAWRCNGLEQVTSQARHTQFLADLQPLLPALNAYSTSNAPGDSLEDVEESAIDALSARLEALPPIDPHLARLVRVVQAAMVLYIERPTQAAPLNRAWSVLRGELPKIRPAIEERLALAAHAALFGTTAHNPQR